MYNAGRKATMMEVKCQLLTALDQASLILIPSHIALTVSPTSGRAQVQLQNRPSTSNATHPMMERSSTQKTNEHTATNKEKTSKATPKRLNATTQAPYCVWPLEDHLDESIPPKPNYSVQQNKACNSSQPHRLGHKMAQLSPTYTHQHQALNNLQSETHAPLKTVLQNQMITLALQRKRATWHVTQPSMSYKSWENMQTFYLGSNLWPTDITSRTEGSSPLIATMFYLPPKTQWIQTYTWKMNLAKTMLQTDCTTDPVTASSLILFQAKWANRQGLVQSMQLLKANNSPNYTGRPLALEQPYKQPSLENLQNIQNLSTTQQKWEQMRLFFISQPK